MNDFTAIILFAHGSTVLEANQGVSRLAEELSRKAGLPATCAFLELAQPDLAAAIAGYASQGMKRIIIVPYFLSMGVHVREDMPRLVAEQRVRFPNIEILVAQSLESHPGMIDLLLSRIQEVLPSGI